MTTETPTTPASDAGSVVESVALYYRDGGSDKVYHALILSSGEGYLVNFSYGRRGTALVAGSKTPAPVSLEKAKTIYGKLVSEKTSKGYTPQDGGQLFAGTENAGRVSGNVPQLLNDLSEAELSVLLEDDNWVLQTKHDGKRIMVQRDGEGVTGSNRKGLVVALPQELAEALAMLPVDTVVDGELVGVTLHIFDTTRWAGQNLMEMPYRDRLQTLSSGLPETPLARLTESSIGREAKRSHLERVRASRGEGVVLKRLDALYRAGRPSSGGNQRKFKFTQSATCRVLSISEKKRSVEVGVLKTEEGDDCCSVGNVTILPNFPIPAVGVLVEVKYLYYYEGGSLYQPIYQGEREDKTRCDLHQSLKRRPSEEDEETTG